MPPKFTNADQVLSYGISNALISLPSGSHPELTGSLNSAKTYDGFVSQLQASGGLPPDLAHHIAATTTYSILEKVGINPKEWLLTIPALDRSKLKYGPDQYDTARRFLGSWSAIQIVLFLIAAAAAAVTIALGIGPAIAAATTATSMLLAGTAVETIVAFLNVQKFLALPRLLIPATISAVATLGSYIAGTQITATGDLTTYVRTAVSQGIDKVNQAEAAARAAGGGGGTSYTQTPRTRITMSKQSKPTLFLGTLFSARISNVAAFDRVVDDKITSKDDLKADAQANLNKWLSTLPGRLIYSIGISNSPFDENGVKQTGTWATLTLALRRISGQTMPIDTILLGPVDPTVYYPNFTDTQQVQVDLPKLLTAAEIANIEFSQGSFNIIDKTGNKVPITFDEAKIPSFATPVSGPQPFSGPVPPGYDEQYYRDTGTLRLLSTTGGTSGGAAAPAPAGSSAGTVVNVSAPMPTPAPVSQPPQPVATPTQTYMPPPPAPVPVPAPSPVVPAKVSIYGSERTGLYMNDLVYSNTPGSILNIRSYASINAVDLGDIPHNSLMKVLGAGDGPGATIWLYVNVPSLGQFGKNGYVSYDYIRKA